jgi:transposase
MGMRTGRPVAKTNCRLKLHGFWKAIRTDGRRRSLLALRARIVLGCASGLSNKAVAARERVTSQTVGKWRRRFLERGVDGLLDEPRPGVPRKIDDARVESIIVQTLESQPRGATHWSTRSMARHSGISTSSVGRVWRAFGLQTHRVETFKLSTDPLFVDKVRDIVGLYLNPPDRALVLCVDEKSQIQALDRTQPLAASFATRSWRSRFEAVHPSAPWKLACHLWCPIFSAVCRADGDVSLLRAHKLSWAIAPGARRVPVAVGLGTSGDR